jgi:hypothetical protein
LPSNGFVNSKSFGAYPSLIMSADQMKRRGKKLESKRGVNMSFSELVQRIDQRDTNRAQQDGLVKPKGKRVTLNRRRQQPAPLDRG